MRQKTYYFSFIVITLLINNFAIGQNFITKWDLSIAGSGPNQITFGVATTGNVSYTWETIPASTTGSGNITGTTATINGLPTGAIIRLKIDSVNFKRIIMGGSVNSSRLLDVEQWGSILWSSMNNAFANCYNLNITATDVPNLNNVTNLSYCFMNCSNLNGPSNINNWNTNSVTNMNFMFNGCHNFNQPIGNWNTSNVTGMSSMFYSCYDFNQAIGNWNTSNVTNMSNLFKYCSNFNQPIGNWNTGAVTNMTGIFNGTASFNQPIGNWNTGAVTNMSEAFFGSSFNQPIGNWNTGAVTNMTLMFGNGACLFNQPIGNWNTGAVTDMTDMFKDNITFNQPIGNWNTGNVTSMKNMFRYAVFNQPIGNWNISNVIDMEHMFAENLAFNQPLGGWVFNSSVYTSSFLYNTPIDCINYSQTLYDWASNPNCPSNVILNAATLSNNHFYGTNVVSQRNYLINSKGWTVSGDLVSSGVCCITLQSTLNANACPNYFFNGQTISTTGVYYDTLTNANGCDSIVTLNLTIVGTVTSNQSQTACNAYFFNGQTLTSNGVYLDTLINTGGCDSIITLNLIINQVDNSTTLNGTIITANEVGAVYQWLECPNYTLISGASNQSYTAVSNGYYAVSISNNGCTDTSNCITVNSVGINNINALTDIIISPNPTNGVLNISSNLNQVATIIKVYNSLGQVILSGNHNNLNTKVDISNFSKGMYYIEINANNKIYRTKLLKN